jgi:MipA family protein
MKDTQMARNLARCASIRRSYAIVLPLCVTALLPFATVALAADQAPDAAKPAAKKWDVVVGGGVAFGPEYEGSGDLQAGPIPSLNVIYDGRYFIGLEGAGVNVWQSDTFNFSVSTNYVAGRNEKDGKRLALDETDAGASLKLAGSYTAFEFLSVSAGVTRDFGAGDGLQAEFGLSAGIPLSEKLTLLTSVSTVWADQNYIRTNFGVSRAGALRSGLAEYEPDAGFKRIDLTVGASYQFNENWVLSGGAGYGWLLGDAAQSPIVEKREQPLAILTLDYHF